MSYNEFLNMMSDDLLLRVFSNDELEEIFNFYDKDKSGFITEVELEEAFKRLGRPLDKNTIKTMVGTYDLNNDGKISFDVTHPTPPVSNTQFINFIFLKEFKSLM